MPEDSGPPDSSDQTRTLAAGIVCRRRTRRDGEALRAVGRVDGAAWTTVEPRPAVEHALDMIGPGRLIFGSDRPVCLLAASCTG
ncbi:amidohydrolase family protein [Micromonospora zamorensis]|uniref:amidohydrolase family protein n=1 Tax=Micromonospora zamorensis TaxID=709883 RepID=UPI00352A129A|nr:amidohydrolase family protein [Micromonospora zamorensis]